jgi:hypothetical protein
MERNRVHTGILYRHVGNAHEHREDVKVLPKY